jgi:hypothetical protein
LEWAEITHPFHPLRGQKLPVLKSRKLAQRDMLSLRGGEHGTLCVPREWTDKADPVPWLELGIAAPILSYSCLRELATLVAALRQNQEKQ